MNCDRCGKPSVYHSTLIVNGVSQTTNLCRECAIKEGVFDASPTSIFDELFMPFADILPFEKVKNIVCPVCKTSLKEFKQTHKLGCPNCYDVFKEEIEKIVSKIAPFSTHKQEPIKKLKSTKKKESKAQTILELRNQMAQAVKEERYEDAAKIKKQIKALESENE